MPLTYIKLTDVTPIVAIGTVPQVLYHNQNGTRTFAAELEFHNRDSSDKTVSFFVVPNNGGNVGVGAVNNRLLNMTIVANDTVYVNPKFPYILPQDGDSIQILANGTGVNVHMRGGVD
jgi:hypothetical protein